MLCEFARELDQLKAEVATLKAMNVALRRVFLGDPFITAINTSLPHLLADQYPR